MLDTGLFEHVRDPKPLGLAYFYFHPLKARICSFWDMPHVHIF